MPAERTGAARWLVIACSALMAMAIGAGCAAPEDGTGQEAPPAPLPSIDSEHLTEAEAELLRQISIVDAQVYSNERLLIETLSASQLDRTQLFEALAEADPEDPRRMYQIAEQTWPVETLQSDRSRYVSYLADLVARSRSYQQKITADDLVAVHQHAVDVMVARARMLNDVSPFFCTSALVVDSERTCESSETRFGRDRDYGVSLHAVFRNLDSQIGPRTRFFPAQYEAPEEALAVEALLTPMVDALRRALESVRELEPPLELGPDHERMMQYLSESLDVFTMPEPGQPAVERLDEQLEEFATLTNAARDDLSPAAMAIVSPFFKE